MFSASAQTWRWPATFLIGLLMVLIAVQLGPALAQSGSANPSGFVGLSPTRLLDTRSALGAATNDPIGTSGSITLVVGGRGGVPTNATAAVMNVTVTAGTASSFLTIWPTGEDRPLASTHNWVGDDTRPNLVTAQLGANGSVNIFNNAGVIHVVADVVGYYVENEPADLKYDLFQSASDGSPASITATPEILSTSTVNVVPAGHTAVIDIDFNAESTCTNSGVGWCAIEILLNGTVVAPGVNQAFDSSDNSTETIYSWVSHSIKRVTDILEPGTYTVTIRASTSGGATFHLDDLTLTSEIHLVS